jgi:GTPase SAR1 family protein
MQQFMGAIGRKASIVNLDPANDPISSNYQPALDIRDLISLETIMQDEEIGLGPNGGVLYALEELEADLDNSSGGGWFEEGLKKLGDDYLLLDCPGQVEIFTHHASLRRVLARLEKMGYRV